jgi:membrane protease YdiL (CAAX protease family)
MFHCKIKEQWKRPSVSVQESIIYLVAIFGVSGVGDFLGVGIQKLFDYAGIKLTEVDISLPGNIAQNVIMVIYVCVLGPVLEEILFRGLILQSLRPWGDNLAILVSGVLFGLMHLNLPQGASAVLAGFFFGFVAIKTGSILPTIVLHILNNVVAMVSSVCGIETYQMLIFDGFMIVISLVLLLMRRIPFHEISKKASSNVVQPEHPYRVVFLQSAAFWVLAALFLVSSFYPAISGFFFHM